MAGVREGQGQLVFGLDIGTRSIVGTVGYLNNGKFHVLAQRSKEHETRSMLDGQIHDIGKVGETITQVKEQAAIWRVYVLRQQDVYCALSQLMRSRVLTGSTRSRRRMFILLPPWAWNRPMRSF